MSTEHPWPDEAAIEAAARAIQPGMKWPKTARGQAEAYLRAAAESSPVVPVSALRDWIKDERLYDGARRHPGLVAHNALLDDLSVFLDTLERTEG